MAQTPTSFLAINYKKSVEARGRSVSYFAYQHRAGNIDPVTDEVVDEDRAYKETGISLIALVEENPSDAARSKFGLEDKFRMIIRIPKASVDAASITFREDDKFVVNGYDGELFVLAIRRTKQVKNDHLELSLAVSEKRGRE